MKRIACVLMTALLASALGAAETVVRIGTVPGRMKYDVEEFTVDPGASVRLVFVNGDEMQHNVVICAPGPNTGFRVAQQAWALGSEAVEKQFVPDVAEALFHTQVVNPGEQDEIVFKAPEAEGAYPYVCTLPGHVFTMRGVMKVGVDVRAPEEAAPAGEPSMVHHALRHLHVMDEPLVVRTFIDGGPPRSIAVGLPGGVNYLFNADECFVEFGWTGMFLDNSPNVGRDVNDRGGGWSKILGERFSVGAVGFPLRLGDGAGPQKVEFKGYKREKQGPVFFFEVDGHEVRQRVAAAPEGRGLRYEFEVQDPAGPVVFRVRPDGVDVESFTAAVSEGVLKAPAGAAGRFDVTITVP